MARYTRSIIHPFSTITADTILTLDLPVNPLSFLLLHLKFQNSTSNTKATIANVLAMLDKVTVRFLGNSIIALSGEDLYAYASILWDRWLHQVNEIDTNNAVRSWSLPIPFGPKPYDPNTAFPATSRGNLQLELDWASSFTNLDSTQIEVESVELPEATPSHFLRATTIAHTPSATGDQTIPLPIGQELVALILFGTTIPTATTATRTINSAELLVDNAQRYVTKVNFESLHNALGLRCLPPIFYDDHTHRENTNATYQQNADTKEAERDDDLLAQYGLIDLDPTKDGEYILSTVGLADLSMRIDAGDTNELRIIPVERFAVGAA